MAKRKWRTVSCLDDGIRNYGSEKAAYAWIADQPKGSRFRVQLDEGYDWEHYITVVSNGDGTTDEEMQR